MGIFGYAYLPSLEYICLAFAQNKPLSFENAEPRLLHHNIFSNTSKVFDFHTKYLQASTKCLQGKWHMFCVWMFSSFWSWQREILSQEQRSLLLNSDFLSKRKKIKVSCCFQACLNSTNDRYAEVDNKYVTCRFSPFSINRYRRMSQDDNTTKLPSAKEMEFLSLLAKHTRNKPDVSLTLLLFQAGG